MTLSELIKQLEAERKRHGDLQVMILDGFNGGGVPRELNVGPRKHQISTDDLENCADCEEMVGQSVIVLGYGSY